MNKNNPLKIFYDIETGRMQNYPNDFQVTFLAIFMHFIFSTIFQNIAVNTTFQNQIYQNLFIIVTEILLLVVLLMISKELFYFKDEEKYNPSKKLSMKVLIYTIILVVALCAFINAICVLMLIYSNMSSIIESIRNILANNFTFGILYFCIIGPISEELIYRGVLLGSLLKKYTSSISIILATGLFSIMHFNMPQFIAALILGTILGVLYTRFRSIILCSIVHSLYNSILVLVFHFDLALVKFKSQSIIGVSLPSILGLAIVFYMLKLLIKESEKFKTYSEYSDFV